VTADTVENFLLPEHFSLFNPKFPPAPANKRR